MELRIGIANVASEVRVEMDDATSIDEVKASITAAVEAESMVWLADKRGHEFGFVAERLGYVVFGARGDEQRIGFS